MFLTSSNIITIILFLSVDQVFQDKLVKQISKFGYPAEVHKMETEDGYILKTYRIPYGKFSNKTNDNVILLNHGIATSADIFISLGPDGALAFFLADQGFDVWLLNARGTFHSRKHKTKSANYLQGAGFWNFSWHEIGLYDIPVNIDYILENTNKSQLLYLGYSQGGTSYFVMMSEKPEYSKKIRASALLAPAVLLEYTESSFLKFLSRFDMLLEMLSNVFKYQELPVPNSPMLNSIFKWFCSSSDNFKEACRDLLSMFGGQDSVFIVNHHGFYSIWVFDSSGITLQSNSKNWQYSYGKSENLKRYNSTVPPEYNLNTSLVPVALFMANGDSLVSIKATYELSKLLPNVAMIYEVPYDNFNHMDYIFAYNAKELVYKPVYNFLKQFMGN